MATSVIGNHVPGKKSLRTGSGSVHQRHSVGHLTISGEAGDVKRLSANDFTNNAGEFNILVQASGGSAEIFGTLADADLAMNPDQDAGDHWISMGTAAPGSVLQLDHYVIALKIEFSGPAIVYVVSA